MQGADAVSAAKGDCRHGGGLFASSKGLWVNDGHGHEVLEDEARIQRTAPYPWHDFARTQVHEGRDNMFQTHSIGGGLGRLARLACLLFVAAAAPLLGIAATLEQTTLKHLDNLRGIQASTDSHAVARYNQQMDDAWKFFLANKGAVIPLLREQLDIEVRKPQPNGLVLLDIGYFLMQQGGAIDRERATAALLAIDTTSPVIRQNHKELFEFTHGVAALHDARVLPFIDKAFLRDKVTVFIPQHALRLDETLVCVFLYGVHGDGAEQHLRARLADRAVAKKVIEILAWLGSPVSVADVQAANAAARDYETFARATAFMMRAGGPQGRAAMLDVREGELDSRSRDYYAQIRPAIASTSYASLRKQFGSTARASLSDDQMRARLAAMSEHYGKDDTTQPLDILDAKLPADELVGELVKIRARTFSRLSDEALSDVEMINALINTLRYRGK